MFLSSLHTVSLRTTARTGTEVVVTLKTVNTELHRCVACMSQPGWSTLLLRRTTTGGEAPGTTPAAKGESETTVRRAKIWACESTSHVQLKNEHGSIPDRDQSKHGSNTEASECERGGGGGNRFCLVRRRRHVRHGTAACTAIAAGIGMGVVSLHLQLQLLRLQHVYGHVRLSICWARSAPRRERRHRIGLADLSAVGFRCACARDMRRRCSDSWFHSAAGSIMGASRAPSGSSSIPCSVRAAHEFYSYSYLEMESRRERPSGYFIVLNSVRSSNFLWFRSFIHSPNLLGISGLYKLIGQCLKEISCFRFRTRPRPESMASWQTCCLWFLCFMTVSQEEVTKTTWQILIFFAWYSKVFGENRRAESRS
jgi:hypothetical protein